MISIKERLSTTYFYSVPLTFTGPPENCKNGNRIDKENQEFDITKRDLEELQGVPYTSVFLNNKIEY